MKRKVCTIAWILLGILFAASLVQAEEPLRVQVDPDTIRIGAFYDGTTVSVTGELPSDSEAVIRLLGGECRIPMKKKGKVFGLLWMNLDTLTFDPVPSACMVYLPGKLEDLLGGRGETAPAWQLTLLSLRDHIRINPEPPDRDAVFQEFLKLKTSEGLYAVKDGVQYTQTDGNKKGFRAELKIPPTLPSGKYNIEVVAVRNGDIIARTVQPLTVRLESLPALLASLAFNHSALYGVLATLIALGAGLLTGLIFGGSKGGH